MPTIVIDIIGYLAPAFLVLSFLFKDVIKLRLINTIGCTLFIIYGMFISAYPVVIANAFIVIINLYHLVTSKKA
ncbi:MAG: hypothetical protein LBK47_07260 [Prevotellaceae bacterium]|jgi:hypothetical protein|nr:hypothetical protein [Prevotellaceae bacterium]